MNDAVNAELRPVLPGQRVTHDGLALHLRQWPVADARGTALIVHGLGEHIGRYAHVAAHLNAWGWSVVGYDQRGHGRSEGPRGRLGADDSLLRDLALVIDAVRASHGGPLLLLGHSMGGLVAARFVAGGLGPGRAVVSRGRCAGAVLAGARPRHERRAEAAARAAWQAWRPTWR